MVKPLHTIQLNGFARSQACAAVRLLLLILAPPSLALLQLKQLLSEEFRSLDDFKAKASQVWGGAAARLDCPWWRHGGRMVAGHEAGWRGAKPPTWLPPSKPPLPHTPTPC